MMVFNHNYHMQLLWALVTLDKLHEILVAKKKNIITSCNGSHMKMQLST